MPKRGQSCFNISAHNSQYFATNEYSPSVTAFRQDVWNATVLVDVSQVQ